MGQKENIEFIRNIRHRVAELRIKKGLTQEELAAKVEVDLKTLQKWEYKYITLKALCKLSEVFDCSPYDFFQISNISKTVMGRPKKNKKL